MAASSLAGMVLFGSALALFQAVAPPSPISPPRIDTQPPPLPPAKTQPTAFDQRVLDAAMAYTAYRRVSERPEWSPAMCMAEGVQASRSADVATHGRKLYYLYAKDAAAYYALADADSGSPVGQVVVKESFIPVEVGTGSGAPSHQGRSALSGQTERPATDNSSELAEMNGKLYSVGAPSNLFIMLKLEPSTPDTDEGWVYATTTPDGKAVLQAGRVESCMECHKETTRDRLYGARWTWPRNAEGKSVPPLKDRAEK